MYNVFAVDVAVARPRHVLLSWFERRAHRVRTRNEEAVAAERIEHSLSHAGHDPHIDDDIGAIGELHADLGNGRADRPHAERDDVHRTAGHAAVEQPAQGRAHFSRWRPVVSGADVVLVGCANEGPVLDPAHVGRVRSGQIGIWALLRTEANERTGVDHHLTQPVVLLLASISPDDLVGLAQRRHFANPVAQLAVGCRTVHSTHLLSLLTFRAHTCRAGTELKA